MDYNRMLFAFHVRELATGRLVHNTPANLTKEEQRAWRGERFKQTVHDVVREIGDIADWIDQGPQEQAS